MEAARFSAVMVRAANLPVEVLFLFDQLRTERQGFRLHDRKALWRGARCSARELQLINQFEDVRGTGKPFSSAQEPSHSATGL